MRQLGGVESRPRSASARRRRARRSLVVTNIFRDLHKAGDSTADAAGMQLATHWRLGPETPKLPNKNVPVRQSSCEEAGFRASLGCPLSGPSRQAGDWTPPQPFHFGTWGRMHSHMHSHLRAQIVHHAANEGDYKLPVLPFVPKLVQSPNTSSQYLLLLRIRPCFSLAVAANPFFGAASKPMAVSVGNFNVSKTIPLS